MPTDSDKPKITKLEAGDPDTQSLDPVADNIAKLKALFPELVTETPGKDGQVRGAVNVDVLKQLVGDATVTDADEKFGLTWHGKRRARQLALAPSTGTLRPYPTESVDWDTTQNLFIEGDNLEVLKLLQKSYSGQVKLIYIDPPYNTGKEFIYPDKFQDNLDTYLRYTGQIDSEGMKLTGNAETSGRFHTNWLMMMYSRLKLARGLLQSDGAIAVSIDDNELHNLRSILDDIFGEENFVGCVSRATGTTTGQDAGAIGASLDYVVVYRKGDEFKLRGLPLDAKDAARFNEEDSRGKYSVLQLRKTGNADRREDRPSMYYPVIAPDGTEVFPIGPGGYESRWRFGPDKYQETLDNDMIVWKESRDGKITPYVKYYLEGRSKQVPNLWTDLDGNKKGTIELRNLLGGKVFDNPKPTALIKRIVSVLCSETDLVLDFFAGTCATADAILSLNAEGANRKFIMVQLPEICDKGTIARKLGYKTISEIGLDRIKKKLASDACSKLEKHQGGVRVFKLDSSNIHAWEPDRDNIAGSLEEHVEHLKADRTEQDILYELLLKRGLDLCVPIETKDIAGKPVQSIGAGSLFACLAESIDAEAGEALALGIVDWHKELDPAGDTAIVFRDDAFADDVVKTNVAAILDQNGLKNVRSL